MNNSLYSIPGSRFDIVDNSQIANIEITNTNRQSECSIVSWAKNAFKVLQSPHTRHSASYHVLKETNE